ncbi:MULTISPECIES: hypothetical protein [unclassified Lysobacter]|nr:MULTISPECIES: hypothetical protein [unclassified Lysobacter]
MRTPRSQASGWRMSGPPQRGGRSERARGSAAQTPTPHPLEYQMYYTI